MLITYQDFNFKADTLAIIEKANEIIEQFEGDGYTLTLRQLYYQFVAKALIENTERSYKRLGSIVTDGRLAGMISWNSIEDRNRECTSWQFEEDDQEVVNGLEYYLNMDFWARQDAYVEVWVEKDALVGVIERTAKKYDVPYMACKGYLSASEAWRAGRRFKKKAEDGKRCVLLHLGDHDPSGIDMTRDNTDRLELFAGGEVEVKRLALNMEQVQKYAPPPNPAKVTDSRATGYIKKYGSESWELDALAPQVIDGLIKKEIVALIDPAAWKRCQAEQDEKRKYLEQVYSRWDDIKEFLNQE